MTHPDEAGPLEMYLALSSETRKYIRNLHKVSPNTWLSFLICEYGLLHSNYWEEDPFNDY